MKVKLLVALATLLSVATAMAQQKYMLPIGSNVNNRPAKVGMSIGNWDTGWVISDEFDYTPAMGGLEQVIKYRLRKLTDGFSPPLGSERDSYSLGVIVEPGPYTVVRFQLDQGKIPPEVLEVKLNYGGAWIYQVQGIKEVRMRLFRDGQQTGSFSTATPNDNYGFALSPCSIGASQDALAYNEVRVSSKYTAPSLWDGTWDYGEMDIVADGGDYAIVNLLNGFIIQYSTPDFMEFLRAPEMLAPRIASIKRSGNKTEITVSAESNASAHLKFSETLNGSWYSVPKYPQPMSLQTGSSQFTHTTEAPASFYRLRLAEEPRPQ